MRLATQLAALFIVAILPLVTSAPPPNGLVKYVGNCSRFYPSDHPDVIWKDEELLETKDGGDDINSYKRVQNVKAWMGTDHPGGSIKEYTYTIRGGMEMRGGKYKIYANAERSSGAGVGMRFKLRIYMKGHPKPFGYWIKAQESCDTGTIFTPKDIERIAVQSENQVK